MSVAVWALALALQAPALPPRASLDVPYVRQERFLCAASCLAMVRLFWGETVTQYEIARQAGWRPERGLTVRDIRTYLDGLAAYRYRIGSGDEESLKAWLSGGCPVIVALDGSERDIQHAVVLTGYDSAGFICHDPARGEGRRMSWARMARRWRPSGRFYCLLVPASGPAPPVNPSSRKGPGR
jgi:ABC-type bacteriocin/lantibiotic exporter with double-glycine peptidase domain